MIVFLLIYTLHHDTSNGSKRLVMLLSKALRLLKKAQLSLVNVTNSVNIGRLRVSSPSLSSR